MSGMFFETRCTYTSLTHH